MEKKKGHPLARLFFGVFFLLLSAVVLLVNLFRMPGGYDWALGLLDSPDISGRASAAVLPCLTKRRRPTTEGERNGDRSFDPGVSAG